MEGETGVLYGDMRLVCGFAVIIPGLVGDGEEDMDFMLSVTIPNDVKKYASSPYPEEFS